MPSVPTDMELIKALNTAMLTILQRVTNTDEQTGQPNGPLFILAQRVEISPTQEECGGHKISLKMADFQTAEDLLDFAVKLLQSNTSNRNSVWDIPALTHEKRQEIASAGLKTTIEDVAKFQVYGGIFKRDQL